MRILVFLVTFLSTSLTLLAQDRTCGTVELQQMHKSASQIQQEREQFEQWLQDQTINRPRQTALEGLDEEIIYQVPVVVHVIHRGEALGEGTNIPDEQIFSQIEALNLDFRHLNADSVNTPSEFQSLMADIEIEFILARRDPDGFSTNGITRTAGPMTSWTMSDNSELKALSYWPAEDYLNIWVAPLGGDLLGWAEFPSSTIIDGVNNLAKNNRLTDGVVITSRAFGSRSIYPQGLYLNNYNQGRTLTHEIGHFFGLRHIWGDGGCSVDDYVDDTPLTDNSYGGCPEISEGFAHSCNNNELSMFMNYMDYVYDECMNLFTLDQKDRMQIVLNNSPRRASLLNSDGLTPPPPLELELVELQSPGLGTCTDNLNPAVLVRNNGTARINKIDLAVALNGDAVQTKSFNLSLQPDNSVVLDLNEVVLQNFGIHQLDIEVVGVNGGIDDNTTNNFLSKQVNYSTTVNTLEETFDNWPAAWALRSEAPLSQWNLEKAPNFSVQNTSAVLGYFDSEPGTVDQLISPTIDLGSKTSAYLLFDYSYVNKESVVDELFVVVSSDCGNNFTDTLFSDLQNSRSNSIPSSYSPAGPVDWQTNVIDLSAYLGQSIQIAFVGRSQGNNNLYLDNIQLREAGYDDLAVKGLVNESGVYTGASMGLDVWVDNAGLNTVSEITINISSAGSMVHSESFSGLNLMPGAREQLSLAYQAPEGKASLEFSIGPDDYPENNSFAAEINYLSSSEFLPYRNYFNTAEWNADERVSISSPGDAEKWTWTADFIGLSSNQFGNKGLHDWFVLPPLNFSRSEAPAIRFKYAYALNTTNAEVLRLWASTNGGKSFDRLVMTYSDDELITVPASVNFIPVTNADWEVKYIDLSEFAGEESILLAFEATNGASGNLYLDDIDIFVSANEEVIELEPGKMATYPNPVTDYYSNLTFSLEEKQDIRVKIIDMRGNTISDQVFTDVLNQTYPLDLSTELNGIYIIQAIGNNFASMSRVMLNR